MKTPIFYPWQCLDAERIVKPLIAARGYLYKKNLTEVNSPFFNRKKNQSTSQAFCSSLPSSILLYGADGIGKLKFALGLCQTLLCENSLKLFEENQNYHYACGQCQACLWFKGNRHPDFHLSMPENDIHLISPMRDWTEGAVPNRKQGKNGRLNFSSKEIKIEQVRVLSEFARISSQCSGLRIVMIYPAESLNDIALNCLLKLIEEPPPSLLFVLVGKHPSLIKPTLVSRCLRIPLSYPDLSQAKDWLRKENCLEVDKILALSGGAPLFAIREAKLLKLDGEYEIVLNQLAIGQSMNVQICMEGFSKIELVDSIRILQRWAIDLMYRASLGEPLVKENDKLRDSADVSCSTKRLGYFIDYEKSISILATKVDRIKLGKFYKSLIKTQSLSRNFLNVKLVIERLLYDYVNVFF